MSANAPSKVVPILSWWTLLFGSLLFLFPFFWTISTSLKTPSEISRGTAVSAKAVLVRTKQITANFQAPNFTFMKAKPEEYEFGKRLGVDIAKLSPGIQKHIQTIQLECEMLKGSVNPQGATPDTFKELKILAELLDTEVNKIGLFPDNPQWENYSKAWTIQPFTRYFINTLAITLVSVVCGLLSSALVGYGFAKFDFRGREVLFMAMLGTMMLPGQVTMIPNFITWTKRGLIDTFFPMILPSCFGAPFAIFFMRQYFMSLPKELIEAAEVDGASPWQTFWQVMIPNAKPALITLGLLSFFAHWDDFFGPLLYLNTQEHYTVSFGLRLFQDQYSGTQMHLLMAAALIHLTPCVILFLLCQRYFVRSIVMSGIKG